MGETAAEAAENPALKNRLILTGALDNPYPVIRLFDVGVLSSTSEGFSNSLVEYAAAGIPTVATDVGGNREIVEDGVTGYLVPPRSPERMATKIVDLLVDKGNRQEFAQKAGGLADSKFGQESIIKQYDGFYKSVII